MPVRRKPVPLEPEAPGMDPMFISKVAPEDLWTEKDTPSKPKPPQWPIVPGYTPRILASNGRPIFGTWKGPQDTFWDYKGRYGFIGGGTYTGKTDLLRWYPWQQIEEDNARIKNGEITESFGQALYLLRETPRLREVMNRCARDFKIACPDISWKAMDKTYVHPNGYRITYGHMENDEDWAKYQGWQITCLLWDELPSFLLSQWDMMDQWVRQPGGSYLTPIQRAGGNPIGIGRAWVKKFFVDFGSGKEVTKKVTVEVEDAEGKKSKQVVARSRMFIFAKVSDNKSVDQAAYLASFADKPPALVRAMRDGDFSSALGELVGRCWDEDVHAIGPFPIPSTRHLFRSCCFTYAETTINWWAVDYDGNLTCYRELHLKNHTAKMVAERIREIEEYAKDPREWSVDKDDGSKLSGVLGPKEAWERTDQRGPSPAETMRRVGVRFSRADENLGAAADQIRDRLLSRTLDGTLATPGLRYFDSCKHSIEEIPSMPADKSDADMPDPKAPSTAYRSTCYAVMSRPIKPEKEKPADDDWDKWQKPKSQRKSRTSYPGMW